MHDKTVRLCQKTSNVLHIFPNIHLYIFLSPHTKYDRRHFIFLFIHNNFICNTKHKLPVFILWEFISSPSERHFIFICSNLFNLIRIPPLIFPILIHFHYNFFVLPSSIFPGFNLLWALLNILCFFLRYSFWFCCRCRRRRRAESRTKRDNEPRCQSSSPYLFLHTFHHTSSS